MKNLNHAMAFRNPHRACDIFLSPPLPVPSFPTSHRSSLPHPHLHLLPHRQLQIPATSSVPCSPLFYTLHLSPLSISSVCVPSAATHLKRLRFVAMASGGRCRRRRSRISSIRRRGVGARLSIHGGEMDDLVMKPDNHDCGEWICARGYRIKRTGRMRVDANGDVYVPDSEDEEAGMEMVAGGKDLADLGGVAVAPNAIAVGGDAAMGNGIDAPTEGIPADAVNVAAEEGGCDGVKVEEDAGTGEEMHPKVAARLKMLLDHIDPTFHDVFVSMLKFHVENRSPENHLHQSLCPQNQNTHHILACTPWCLQKGMRSINIQIYSLHNNLFIFLQEMRLIFLDFILVYV